MSKKRKKDLPDWGNGELSKKWIKHTSYLSQNENTSYRHLLIKEPLQKFLSDYFERHNLDEVKIMEFGCGDGFFSLEVLSEALVSYPNVKLHIHGIDIGNDLLELFKKNTKKFFGEITSTVQKIDLSKEDDFDKKYYGQYNLIISIFAMHNIADFTSLFNKLKKVLRRHGEFFFVVVNPEFAYWLNGRHELREVNYVPNGGRDYSFSALYPIVEGTTNKTPLYVPYYNRSIEKWQKIFHDFDVEFLGLKPIEGKKTDFENLYKGTIYDEGIFNIKSSLCITGKLKIEIMSSGFSLSECVDYFGKKYPNDFKEIVYTTEDFFLKQKQAILKNQHEAIPLINDLEEISKGIGEKIYIIKRGLISAGSSFTLHRDSYFIPEFIFREGDILGDFEAKYSGLTNNSFYERLFFLKKKSSFKCSAYSQSLIESAIPNLKSAVIKHNKKYDSLKNYLSNGTIGDSNDLYKELLGVFTGRRMAISDTVIVWEITPNKFIDILKNDVVVKNWYIKQNILKTKRIKISSKEIGLENITKEMSESEKTKCKVMNELKILLAIIINYYYYQNLGENNNDLHTITTIFTHRKILIDPDRVREEDIKNDQTNNLLNNIKYTQVLINGNRDRDNTLALLEEFDILLKKSKGNSSQKVPSFVEIFFNPNKIDFQNLYNRLALEDIPLIKKKWNNT